MFKFTALKFQDDRDSGRYIGDIARHEFNNGYMLIVLSGDYLYEGRRALHRLWLYDPDDELVFRLEVMAPEMLGWLTPEQITEYGRQAEALPGRVTA